MKTNNSNIFKGYASTLLIGLLMLALQVNHCQAQISFTDSGQRLGNGSSNDVALGDLDGDGDLDAFVINGQWNVEEPNKVLINNSTNQNSIGYENRFIDAFRYGIYVPPDYSPEKKYHLMVYLHGYSDTTSWDFSWYKEDLQAEFPCIVLTPKCPTSYADGWGNSWDMIESYAMHMTFRIIDTLLKNYNIDTTRMHINGTSMGGFGTFYALASHPGMFASAYATCGGGKPSTANALVNTPLWIFHGSNDNTVPVTQSRNMYSAILAAGGTHVRYTEYPGVGHNSWENVSHETTLDHWLLSQQKGSVHEAPDPVESFQCNLNINNKPYLEWSPPADELTNDKMIWYYRVYRNSALFATLNNDKFYLVDSTVLAENQYIYSASAVNYYFIESSPSSDISLNIPAFLKTENLSVPQGAFSIMPNPVVDHATLSFDLEGSGHARIQIYNSLGQTVEKISDEVFPQGTHFIEWNAIKYSKGVYYAAFESKDNKSTIKLVIN
jgi:predicted esterase